MEQRALIITGERTVAHGRLQPTLQLISQALRLMTKFNTEFLIETQHRLRRVDGQRQHMPQHKIMDWAQLILQLGISVVTLYILREALLRNDKRIDARDDNYHKFVSEHNYEMVKLIVQSTTSIKESSDAIKETGEFVNEATKTMSEMRDHFIKSIR